MQSKILVRPAIVSECERLEAIQWRASLNNPGDRDALLANPDAIVKVSNFAGSNQICEFVARKGAKSQKT